MMSSHPQSLTNSANAIASDSLLDKECQLVGHSHTVSVCVVVLVIVNVSF